MSILSLIKIRAPIRFLDALEMQKLHGAELEQSTEKLAKLIFLQHSAVFTLGRSTDPSHLLCSEHDLVARTGAEVIHADRGGSVTFHGPGQLVAYLLLNLRAWNLGIHEHLRLLEVAVIGGLRRLGIEGRRQEGMTGIWVQNGNNVAEKVCAIGVSARRWVTYHGLSLNVDLPLEPFQEIIPCGLKEHGVTSIAKILNREVCMSDVESAMAAAFADAYQSKIEIGMV
jgi:lipoate-protein ligase B